MSMPNSKNNNNKKIKSLCFRHPQIHCKIKCSEEIEFFFTVGGKRREQDWSYSDIKSEKSEKSGEGERANVLPVHFLLLWQCSKNWVETHADFSGLKAWSCLLIAVDFSPSSPSPSSSSSCFVLRTCFIQAAAEIFSSPLRFFPLLQIIIPTAIIIIIFQMQMI